LGPARDSATGRFFTRWRQAKLNYLAKVTAKSYKHFSTSCDRAGFIQPERLSLPVPQAGCETRDAAFRMNSGYIQPRFRQNASVSREAKFLMNKNGNSLAQPSFNNVLAQRQDAATQFIGAQAVSAKWTTLPGSRPVRLAEVRANMCRWPIGDPQQFDTFRFCGCRRLLGDSYCADHKKMAFAPAKPVRSVQYAESSSANSQTQIQDHSKD
jgi:hypothetical protein